jgi:hypothetical protein
MNWISRGLVLLLILFSVSGRAATSNVGSSWEVAIIFLGAGEANEYQLDLDKNLIELARMPQRVKLGVLREFSGHAVEYFPDPKSSMLTAWDALFESPPSNGVRIPGEMKTYSFAEKTVLRQPNTIQKFLSQVFRDPSAKRLLIIYGHGEGFRGLNALPLLDFENLLKQALLARESRPPLDILWMESCFMANIESITQLQGFSDFYLASEDAEFASGAPFDTLQFLPEKDSARDAAIELGERYLESYSYFKKGDQRDSIETSGATISLIENKRVNALLPRLKEMSAWLNENFNGDKKSLERKARTSAMEDDQLVDLGALAAKTGNKDIALAFEMTDARLRQTNPRLPVFAPQENSWLVYGYEDWSRGDQSDTATLAKLNSQLQPETYINGPNARQWPARSINKRLYLKPFGVGLREFNYFFVDKKSGKALTPPESFSRKQDYFTYSAKNETNPVIFYGYTQKKGADSEIYNGISVLNPSVGIPSVEYTKLRFSLETNWGS